ncbi:MAG: hypothetical protein ACE5LV_07220, partial [Candidatus Aminicenantales bacterium]
MIRRMLCFLLGVMLLGGWVSPRSLADDPRVTAAFKVVEVWIDSQLDYDHIPGMSAGLVYDQELVWGRG